jgi:ABC-type polysaccharide/polyol phosphate export permease
MMAEMKGGGTKLPLILYLARRELARRYAGSMIGAAWALAYPILQIAIYWGIASYALRPVAGGTFPLGVMLIAGMPPWFMLSEALSEMALSFTANTALLKRLVVPPAILLLARLVAAFMVHGAVLAAAIIVLWGLGHPPTLYLALLLYFAICGGSFALAVGCLLALANVPFRDVGQGAGPVLMLWFWATPIVWPAAALPAGLRWIVTWNPLAYLVEGYRSALLGPGSSLPGTEATLAFWLVTLFLFALAWLAFRRFERELADFL